MQRIVSLCQHGVVVGLCVGILGLLAVTAAAQNAFNSGSTGADGALVFYAPPPGRANHAMAYDTVRQVVVLFGGSSSSGNDTWEWNNTRWTQKNLGNRPSTRTSHAMVYDSTRRVIVLFGGFSSSSSPLGDTWEYDGANWTLKTPATSPTPRYEHAMVYDTARQRVVLFGGFGNGYRNDTWEYDGTTWTQKTLSSSPPARGYHAMAYDTARQVTVLFGGFNVIGDTWEYNGTTWTQKAPSTSPSGRYDHAMVYDTTLQRVVLFGGYNNGFLNDTWEYNGTTWNQKAPPISPSARDEHDMAYDSARQITVLFGGRQGADETWLWNGITWVAPPQTQSASVIDLSAKPDGIWQYTTIDIPTGIQVRFRNNPANTPVVWLATGLVHIAGTLILDGANGSTSNVDPASEALGGPGGFNGGLGGRRFDISGSFAGTPGGGPGGGLPGQAPGEAGGDAGYSSAGAGPRGGAAYSDRLLQPLLGGSGGGGGASSNTADGGNGGGGGGAILIASSDRIQLDGTIRTNGGSNNVGSSGACANPCGGRGTGGAIRLVTNRIDGAGSLQAIGPTGLGSPGRIRLEAFFVQSSLSGNPLYVVAPPLSVTSSNAGAIRITNVAGQTVPQPPAGDLNTPDVVFTAPGNVIISLATTHIPSGTPLTVRITASGQVITVQSTPTDASGNATATATVPAGIGTIQAFATFTAP